MTHKFFRRFCKQCKTVTDHKRITILDETERPVEYESWCIHCGRSEKRYDLRKRVWAGV
jgi:RNase P subunit RPR2